ncbi:MAG TPA: ABC transporter permease [Mucilaginibacter sp.]|jgi:putative ABC transport system permease protein
MIKNYFKIALRNLTRQKLFSLINISGLAVGLAVCMMIMLYVAHEHSYDSFHKNADRIVTLRANIVRNGDAETSENFSDATAPALKEEVPAVENYSASFKYFLPFVVNNASTPQSKFNEDNLLFADAGFFKFFSFKLISGQPGNVLSKPFSVVISRDMAKKYFGDSNPIGKILAIKTDGKYNYQVTGIAENNPSNSSVQFNFVASASSLKQIKSPFPYLSGQPKLGGGVFNVFLLLRHPGDTAKVLSSIRLMIKRHPLPGRGRPKIAFSLPLLTDIHLHTHTGDVSNVKYLKTFPVVAVLILLLALFNYMSLSTARSTLRAKEVGVRKISGASRKTLALQFYTESAIFTLLSFILGYLLCYLFKPWFLNVLQLKIDNAFLYSPLALTLLATLLVLTTLVAGFYPALALSAFKPVVTLKGKMSKQAGGVAIRKIFTTLQFAISIALIVCGIIIDRQLYFFRHTNSGMDRNNIVMLAIPGDFGKKYQPLKKDIGSLAGISEVATSNYTLFRMYDWTDYKGISGDSSTRFFWQAVDRNFISILGLQWKFAPAPGTDLANPNANKVIINEAAVEKFNLGENPVGRFLPPADNGFKPQVAGVLKDFNFQSMQYAIAPFGLYIAPDSVTWSMPGCCLYAKIKPHVNLPSLIASMQTIYKKYDQNTPLSYSFVDEVFDAQYKAEDRLASIFSVFTGITILLAALGLFGLAAFTIEQRTKEIGIRKILGASLSAIGIMLSKDFLKLVLLAIVIASPVAWYFMHDWLQHFAYRIPIDFWMFGAAGLLSITVAILTIGYHAFRAAVANPVDSLRSE